MRELSEIEARLKSIYAIHPAGVDYTHIYADQLPEIAERAGVSVSTLAPHPLNDELLEEEYFQRGDNVAVFRHIRYLPPVLHKHNFFELIYVNRGKCGNYIDEKMISMEQGDLCIISPKHIHALSAYSDDADIWNILIRISTFETTFFDVISDKDVLSAFFMHCLYGGQDKSCLLFHTGGVENGRLHYLLEALMEEYGTKKKYRSRMLDSLLSMIFVTLLREHEEDVAFPMGEKERSGDNPMQLLSYIQRNFAFLTLQDLAAHFGYSVRHTARMLKDSTGQNFGDIVRDLRLHKAAELLSNPDLAIPDIIETVGYSDVSAFYRAFKTYYGMNPATYRRKHRS